MTDIQYIGKTCELFAIRFNNGTHKVVSWWEGYDEQQTVCYTGTYDDCCYYQKTLQKIHYYLNNKNKK